MIGHEAQGVSYKEAVISFLGGAALGLLTPGKVGEFTRVMFITNGDRGKLVGIAIVDKLIDLEVALGLAVMSVHFLYGAVYSLMVLMTFALGAVFIFAPNMFGNVMGKIIRWAAVRERIKGIIGGIVSIPKRVLIHCLCLRIVVSLVDIFQFYLLINSFGSIGLLDVIVVYPIVILSNILPLTIGGIGVREGISMFLLSRYGINAEAAVSASFLLFCLNTLLPAVIGTLFVPRIRLLKGGANSEVAETIVVKNY
jgi:uncharacterized membrane protein YbhN (UPF0104 family)